MTTMRSMFVAAFAILSACAGFGIARAQHLDVLVEQMDGRLVTGSADFDGGAWTLGRRVYSGEFDGDFAVNNPGYNALAAGSPALPEGSQALPGSTALAWDFLPMTIEAQRSNLFYWNGQESDGTPGITPGDVEFGALPGPAYTLGLFDESSTAFTVDGSPTLTAGGVIDDTDATGALHTHRFYQLLDNDGNGATPPADGIYLFAMQLRMSGLTASKPICLVFGTLGSSVAALDSAAMPWVEARVDTLIGLAGDYNFDGMVDAADYVVWRGTQGSTIALAADGDFNGMVDTGDYGVWRANFGAAASGAGAGDNANVAAAPEAAALSLVVVAMICLSLWRRLPVRIEGNYARRLHAHAAVAARAWHPELACPRVENPREN